jgi:hypothetical protein
LIVKELKFEIYIQRIEITKLNRIINSAIIDPFHGVLAFVCLNNLKLKIKSPKQYIDETTGIENLIKGIGLK